MEWKKDSIKALSVTLDVPCLGDILNQDIGKLT